MPPAFKPYPSERLRFREAIHSNVIAESISSVIAASEPQSLHGGIIGTMRLRIKAAMTCEGRMTDEVSTRNNEREIIN